MIIYSSIIRESSSSLYIFQFLLSLYLCRMNAKYLKQHKLSDVFTSPILPSVISNWSLVVHLNLRRNSFSGNIPPELGQLTDLNYLSLDSNYFGGGLPSQIGNLNLLYTLNVIRNHLTRKILQSIGNFT